MSSPTHATPIVFPAPADTWAVDPEAARHHTRLVLLGTSGGPPWWYRSDRAGISSAVVVGEAVYLVDCGEGWGRRYVQAGLGPAGYQKGIDNLRAAFLTHLHSDHDIDYPNLLVLAWHNGSDGLRAPVDVFGPGDRGVLPPVFGPGTDGHRIPVVSPESPTPGLVEMTQLLAKAYATDLNDRMRDYRKVDLTTLFTVHDIVLPDGAGEDPNGDPSPDMDPFPVFEDECVRVSAILVNHAPVFPAFAFRFDTADASIVFSGDTGPCDNLVKLARGADVLVHEVIDRQWVEGVFPTPPSEQDRALMNHLLAAHTAIEDVGPIAERAGVRTLVLNHLAPGNNPVERWRDAQTGFSGRLVVGEDRMQIGFGGNSVPSSSRDDLTAVST